MDGQLLFYADVHAHVHERIGFTLVGGPVMIEITFPVFEHSMVFRVLQYHLDETLLDSCQRCGLAVFVPGIEKYPAQTCSVIAIHGLRTPHCTEKTEAGRVLVGVVTVHQWTDFAIAVEADKGHTGKGLRQHFYIPVTAAIERRAAPETGE